MSDLKDETLRRAQELADFKLLSSGDIPKIDLYMEQVTSLLEQEMGPSLRRKDESVFKLLSVVFCPIARWPVRMESKRLSVLKKHLPG